MDTHADTTPRASDTLLSRLHPGHLTVLAFALGAIAVLLADGQPQCSEYGAKSLANGLIVAGLVVQAASLVFAVVRAVARVPGAGGGLAASAIMTLMALPAALAAAIAVNGLICGF